MCSLIKGAAGLRGMYFSGFGVKQDYSKAVAWYQKAAEAGSAVGMTNLGYMYQYGDGVTRDDGRAIVWY